ncbi:MAG TPA: pentapeptide repeat-containing protein [Sedimentisphaerales bacterium]|nr:pentapeptide repeat-containing protein [Sedimentisphaerales bacterium]
MSSRRISIYVFFGIILPATALAVNYCMFAGSDDDMLYIVGAMLFLPRLSYLYVTIGSGIVTLLLWIVYFRKYGKRYNGFIGGILLFNAIFYLVFGIAALDRLWVGGLVWLPPFCAVPILFLSGVRALRIARTVMHKWQIVLTSTAGFLFVLMLSLFIVRQPWGLIKYLPNAQSADLSGMDLSNIYLDGCSGVTFEEADLSYADLSYAYLVHCNLNMCKANLQEANLNHAVLSIVDLTKADLRGANLDNAEIYEVNFNEADLQGASLGFHARGRIDMREANLCGADLRKIKNIPGVYFWGGAIYDSATLWPKDFNPAEKGAILLADENTTESN